MTYERNCSERYISWSEKLLTYICAILNRYSFEEGGHKRAFVSFETVVALIANIRNEISDYTWSLSFARSFYVRNPMFQTRGLKYYRNAQPFERSHFGPSLSAMTVSRPHSRAAICICVRAQTFILGNYLRKQPSIALLLHATHLEHPGRVEFLGMPSVRGAEAGFIKRATHTAATSLRETAVAAISAPFHSATAATRHTVAQIFIKATANRKQN